MNETVMRISLERISSVVGVKGSFVFDADGRVLAMALPAAAGATGAMPAVRPASYGVPALTSMIPPEPTAASPSAEFVPAAISASALSTVARTAAQTMAGLRSVARRRPGDVDLLYTDGRLLIKSLTRGCLCVLCSPRVNLPLVNLTADAAAHRLSALLREPAKAAEPAAVAARPKQDKPAAKGTDRLSSFLRPFSR